LYIKNILSELGIESQSKFVGPWIRVQEMAKDEVKPEYVQCGTRRFRRFSQEDIIKAALIKKLVDKDKYTLEGAKRKLKETHAINNSGYQWALKFGSIEKSLPPSDR